MELFVVGDVHADEGNEKWLKQCGYETLQQFEKKSLNIVDYMPWLRSMPLYYETDRVFISHAGISIVAEDPFEESHPKSVLWNRSRLENIEKLQIIGHTPCKSGKAEFNKESNVLNIDTGAYLQKGLTAMKIDAEGKIIEIIFEPTQLIDINDN